MSKHAVIEFSVSGYVRQSIHLLDPENYPAKKIVKMLNSGEACTTMQEGGSVDITADGKVIAAVESVDNECEYDDFELIEAFSYGEKSHAAGA